MAAPASLKRASDPSGDLVATVQAANGAHAQVVTGMAFKNLYDEASPSTAYIGQAEAGAATSAPVWRIKQISYSGASVTSAYADGNANFDNVWDDRAALSYS